jgi:hypothetical protein
MGHPTEKDKVKNFPVTKGYPIRLLRMRHTPVSGLH